MVILGTHSAIERAELATPRLPVRALNFYPDNQQLKKLVAERDLEVDVLKDINRRKW